MYFGDAKICGEEIARAIEYSALILGAKETKIFNIDEWWYFCADKDWLFNSTFKLINELQVFDGPCPFPEANQANAYRCEALCLPFSSDAFTISNNKIVLLKGNLPSEEFMAEHQSKLGLWGRIVCFKFISNV